MAIIVSPFTETFKSIKRQFIAKEKLVKSSFVIQKKNSDIRRKNVERERFINYENTLEKSLKFIGTPIRKIGKKLGFLDSLKQFIVNVLLGFITVRLLKYLPQLLKVFTTILKVGDFILDMSGKLLNGLVTFVDKGYQAAEHARKMVRSIGGEKAVNTLDSMNNQANSLLNSIMIAGMLFSDFGGVGTSAIASGKATDVAVDVIKDQVTKQVAEQTAKTAARASIGPLSAVGIVLGTGLLFSAIGEGSFQIKKLGKGLQAWIGGKLNESSQDKNPVTRFLKKGFFGWMQATLGPPIFLLNMLGTNFDILGAPFRYGIELIRAAFMKLNDDRKGLEKQNKNLGKFDARIRDSIREHYFFMIPIFKMIGMKGVANKLQTPGSFGSLYGEKAAKDMGYYRGGVVKKFAGGGYTGGSVGNENKKVEISRTFEGSSTSLNPGSRIGGSNMIGKIFPYTKDSNRMNQYGYMESSYYSLSDSGSLSPILSSTVKTIFGDKIEDKDYTNMSDSLSSFLMSGISEENPSAYQTIYSSFGNEMLSGIIKSQIMNFLNDKFAQIETQLRMQLGLYPPPGSNEGSEADACAAACDTGSGSGVAVAGDAVDKAILDLISSVEAQSYDTMNVSRGATAGKPTQMTVSWLAANANGAIGRYQQMPEYVLERVIAAGGKGSDKFTPELQVRTALKMLYDGHGFARWRSGQMSDDEFGNRLSATWRGLPHSSGGTYPDQYAGRNKAHISRPAFMARLAQIKRGAGPSTAKIAPGSPAASADSCVCDPNTPDATNIGGQVQAAGATTGGTISGYPITSTFGPRWGKTHGGIDVGAPSGKPIAVNVPGEVVFAGYSGGYGNVVDIWIPTLRQMFRMAHMRDKPSVSKGQKTAAGQLLGYVGSTGSSTGAHVHFEAHDTITSAYGNKDPMPYAKYLTIGREFGGPTLSGGVRLLHKGEYVIDKDSVDLFGGIPFFSMINNIENENQRSQKSSQLIQHVSKYTGRKIDQRPDVILQGEDNYVSQLPPIMMPSRTPSIGGMYNSSPNWEQDILSMRG